MSVAVEADGRVERTLTPEEVQRHRFCLDLHQAGKLHWDRNYDRVMSKKGALMGVPSYDAPWVFVDDSDKPTMNVFSKCDGEHNFDLARERAIGFFDTVVP